MAGRPLGISRGYIAARQTTPGQADVELVFDNVQGALGGLDVLVSSAGISGPTGPIEAIDGPGWERTIAVNLNSQFYSARRAVPLLKQSTSGPSLITMGSVRKALLGERLAAATPHAPVGRRRPGDPRWLSNSDQHGIRVGTILLGTVDGMRMARPSPPRAAAAGVGVDEMREQYLDRISLRRMVTDDDDVAALAMFLCSPAARRLRRDEAVSVDGNVEYL